MKKERVLLLCDLSYQTYRMSAAHPLLKDADDNFTGGLYGFWMSLAAAIRDTGATDLVVCLDVKPYVRSLEYPEYKFLRKSVADPVLKERQVFTMKLVIDSLESIGVMPWGVPGFESDDLIGYVVRRHRNRFARIYAMSNDSDLFQLFDVAPNFSVYATDMFHLKNAQSLRDDYNISGAQYMMATALMGTHNDIAGIVGVGLKTAIKAVKDPALLRTYRARYGDMIDRNLRLIALPHADLPDVVMPTQKRAAARNLYKSLGRYDVQVTGAMMDAVIQIQPKD